MYYVLVASTGFEGLKQGKPPRANSRGNQSRYQTVGLAGMPM
jgi:hypothetical protein